MDYPHTFMQIEDGRVIVSPFIVERLKEMTDIIPDEAHPFINTFGQKRIANARSEYKKYMKLFDEAFKLAEKRKDFLIRGVSIDLYSKPE